jgi:hypothetical protein
MYEWIKDPIWGWVFVPEWMAEMCRAERGFGIDREADRRAYSQIHSGAPASARVTVVGAPKTVTPGEPAKAATPGWSEPLPLKTPHVDQLDRVAKAFEEQDKAEAAFRRRLKP